MSFFEGFLSGFGTVASDIASRKAKAEAESEALISRTIAVEKIKMEMAEQAEEAKRKRLDRNNIEADLYRNKRRNNPYTQNTTAQAAQIFGYGNAPASVQPQAVEEPVIDDVGATVQAPTIQQPQISSVTQETAEPYTEEEYRMARAGISEKTILSSSPERVDELADAKARQLARTRQDREARLAVAQGGLDVRNFGAGRDAQGNPVSYYDENAEVLGQVLAESGIPEDLAHPYLFAKDSISRDLLKNAITQKDNYYQGTGQYSFRNKLDSVQQANDGFGKILGLAKDANTGLFVGPVELTLSKITGSSSVVSELNKLAETLAPRMRVPGSGSSSDKDVEMFLNSLADIQSSKSTNVAQMVRLLELGKRAEASMLFDAYVNNTLPLSNPAKVSAMFEKYWEANPAFVKDKSGNKVFNNNAMTPEEWFKSNMGETSNSTDKNLRSMNTAPTAKKTEQDELYE